MSKHSGFSVRYALVNTILFIVFSLFLLYFILSVFSVNPYEVNSAYKGIGKVESTGLHRSIVLCMQFDPAAAETTNRSGIAVTLFFIVQWLMRGLMIVFRKRTSVRILYTDVSLSFLMFLAAFRNFIILLF